MRQTLFDLDHTLLDGDSDQLWCEFLMERGVLPREPYGARNRQMASGYAAGQVSAQALCDFYIGTLTGRSADERHSLRRDHIDTRVVPRIGQAALDLVARHRDAGDLVLLATATCRFLSELTAVHLGMGQLIATECETAPDGHFDRPQPVRAHHARRQGAAPARLAGAPAAGPVGARLHAVQRFDQRPAAAVRRAPGGGGEPRQAPGRRGGAARLAGPRPVLSAAP